MTAPLTEADLLPDALRALEFALGELIESHGHFWACPGPGVPVRPMASCHLCREIRRVREFYKRTQANS